MAEPSTGTWTFTGRHMLFALLAFFGIVFAMNIYMVRVAISTNSGLEGQSPYRSGLKYNERIAAAERQEALGWSDRIALADGGSRLVVTLSDRNQAAVEGLKVAAVLGRPTTVVEDESLVLEEKAPGQYEAVTKITAPGYYIASIEAIDPSKADDGVIYRARTRLWLKP